MQILIVDHNQYARHQLFQMLLSLPLSISNIYQASNGMEAIVLLEQHSDISLVITETTMPKLGGLDIAKYLLKQNRQIPVIITTRSNQFSDAKAAILYHVKSYLTKPIQAIELQEAILQILQEKQHDLEYAENVKSQFSAQFIEQLSLKELLENSYFLSQFMSKVVSLCTKWDYRVCVLQTQKELNTEEKQKVGQMLLLQAPQNLKATFYFKRQDEYVAILFGKRETLEKPEISELIYSNINKIRSNFHCDVSAAIGKVHFGLDRLYPAYEETISILSQRLLQGWNRLYSFDIIRCHYHILTREKELELQSALKKSDYFSAKAIISSLLHEPNLIAYGNIFSIYDFTITLLKMMNQIYLSLGRMNSAIEEKMMKMLSGKCDFYQYYFIEQLEEEILDLVYQLCSFNEQKSENRNYDIIKEILEYIESNYQYDISLQDLALHKYFINPSHLSRLFKSTVGQTFSKYLISVRIQKAKYLLENSNLKINDITMNVGYNDSSHFVQSFKKMYGITPKEYRSNFEKSVRVG